MKLVERYILGAVLPYFALALLILTVALFAQQTTRLGEILSGNNLPFNIIFDILTGLLPSVLVFTIPMSLLVGITTGLGRMGSDSELTSLRAGGVGTWRLATPVLLLGLVLTMVTLYLGLIVTPAAVGLIRRATFRAGVSKLESPVEPRVFNMELPGKVIYVKDGDHNRGVWEGVFIHAQEPDRTARLVTARTGRIDTTAGRSELVLNDVVVTTLSEANEVVADGSRIVSEKSAQLRVRLDTGREALLKELAGRRPTLEERGWRGLLEESHQTQGAEQQNVLYALHRRLALGFGPLALTVLGLGLGLHARRGGRGVGFLAALGAIIAYYLLSLGGEALSRTGMLPVPAGAWLATFATVMTGTVFLTKRGHGWGAWSACGLITRRIGSREQNEGGQRPWLKSWPAPLLGLLDVTVLQTLGINFVLTFAALIAVFLIFTLFELWRFIIATNSSVTLVALYLFYLIPLAGIGLAPISMLVTVLITYALMARRSEAIAWWSSGQSLYRLALPGILFASSTAVGYWFVQENLLPAANRKQDVLRGYIRGGEVRGTTPSGRQWLAVLESKHIYSYKYGADESLLLSPLIYIFDKDGVHLAGIIAGERAVVMNNGAVTVAEAAVLSIGEGLLNFSYSQSFSLHEKNVESIFKPTLNKPSELNHKQLSDHMEALNGQRIDTARHLIASYRKQSDPFSPLVMTLIGIPLALAFGRKSAIHALALAVLVGLSFWAALSFFQQLGYYKFLPPIVAALSPALIFTAAGIYLFAKART